MGWVIAICAGIAGATGVLLLSAGDLFGLLPLAVAVAIFIWTPGAQR